MAIGTVGALALLALLRVRVPLHRDALKTYLAASVGIYGAMLSVYWGSQFIPSGLVAVLFGLNPLFTAFMAALWLNERSLTASKLGGIAFGLAGLAVVFQHGMQLSASAAVGILAVLLSVTLHSISTVWVKRLGNGLPAMAVNGGGLSIALLLYLVTWTVFDGQLPQSMTPRASAAILYLGCFATAFGFSIYYYALKHLPAGTIALITLITPVCALLLGQQLNGETIDPAVWVGTALILSGLFLHQGVHRVRWRRGTSL